MKTDVTKILITVESFPVRGFSGIEFRVATFETINGPSIGAALGLGFAMSLLFFMDQGVSAQLVDQPTNKLKKGNANDLDLLNVAAINIVLSLLGLPWMHGLLPHSPLHVQSLADFEEKITAGHLERVVVRVRETRLAAIFCHILIIITFWFIPFILSQIPVPVLDGLFLYCAVASLTGNSFYERFTLLFTQQSKYPPAHYIRMCPQKVVHIFTLVEIAQLAVLVFVGYAPWPYLQITFPALIALLIPFR